MGASPSAQRREDDSDDSLSPADADALMPKSMKLRRRRSLMLPPGFAHQFDTFKDERSGVVFQAGYDAESSYQPAKVMKYDPQKLFYTANAWHALRSATAGATVANGIPTRILVFCLIAIVFCMFGASPFGGDNSEEALETLNNGLGTGLFFIVGPYVGTAVSRWWSVRKDGVGGLWGAVDDLCIWAAAWFHKGSVADHAARALVLRYGLLSHALLYKQARGEDDQLSDLVAGGLLLEHEKRALEPLVSKPLVVWAWMTHFWTKALSGQLEVTPILHAAQLAPTVMGRCADGRGSVGLALAFVDSQQPFPYVHLLALLTDLALTVNAATVGLQAGRGIYAKETTAAEVPLLLATAFFRIASFVLVFNGLLAVAVQLDNPLGDDPADLPALAYHTAMKKEGEAFAAGIDAINASAEDGEWWEGLTRRGRQ